MLHDEDILPHVFENLDLPSRFRARRCCTTWRAGAANGCAHLRLKPSAAVRSVAVFGAARQLTLRVGQVRLHGHRTRLELGDVPAAAGEVKFDRERWLNRTRGHLPQPVVFSGDVGLVAAAPLALASTRGGAALAVDHSVISLRNMLEAGDFDDDSGGGDDDSEDDRDSDDALRAPQGPPGPAAASAEGEDAAPAAEGQGEVVDESDRTAENYDDESQKKYKREAAAAARKPTVLQSLDLAASMYQPYERVQTGSTGPIVDSFRDTKPKSLQRLLCEVDLGGLCWLQSLSVRGCGSLEILLVPPCLTALDASGASRLRTLSYGFNNEQHAGCQVLNLNGCRELRFAGLLARPNSLAHCRELDLSYTVRLPVVVVASALASAGALASLSLRYTAKDAMLLKLAASPAAQTLRLVDCAFSVDMTDAGVETLVTSAARLQRINLRGCRAVSTGCYNQTPVTLLQRSRADSDSGGGGGATGGAHASGSSRASPPSKLARKGDNISFFIK